MHIFKIKLDVLSDFIITGQQWAVFYKQKKAIGCREKFHNIYDKNELLFKEKSRMLRKFSYMEEGSLPNTEYKFPKIFKSLSL